MKEVVIAFVFSIFLKGISSVVVGYTFQKLIFGTMENIILRVRYPYKVTDSIMILKIYTITPEQGNESFH